MLVETILTWGTAGVTNPDLVNNGASRAVPLQRPDLLSDQLHFLRIEVQRRQTDQP